MNGFNVVRSIFALSLCLAGLGSLGCFEEQEHRIAAKRRELADIREHQDYEKDRRVVLERKARQLRGDVAKLEGDLRKMEAELDAMKSKLTTVEQEQKRVKVDKDRMDLAEGAKTASDCIDRGEVDQDLEKRVKYLKSAAGRLQKEMDELRSASITP